MKHPELRLQPLVLSLICLGLTPALAQNLPTGLNSVAGGVTLGANPPANTLNINQRDPRAIAQWQTFSIANGNTVNVAQPSASSVLLNRVVGNQLSTIAGSLNANGHVYLVNPNGVLFSAGSSVNVGGLIASTLDMTTSNADFLAGSKQLVFERADSKAASVVNQGKITASAPDGVVALMGAEVRNTGTIVGGVITDGTINVASGSAGLISARKVIVDFEGDGLTKFTIPADSAATAALVDNSGAITADGGRIALMAASTAAKTQVVNQTGVLQARSLQQRNGEIVLSAGVSVDASTGVNVDTYSPNGLRVSGQIDATGGQVSIRSGQDITVTSLPPFDPNATVQTAPMDGGSFVDAGALGYALGHASSVKLESAALATPFDDINGYSAGYGVRFDFDAQVVKSEGADTSLIVNSARNIGMSSNSALLSGSGALNIDFNADAKGAPLPDVLPIHLTRSEPTGGAIELQDARIESNGGNIRFYGQSDPDKGRAVGSDYEGGVTEYGVVLRSSLLSTCGPAEGSCTLPGVISLRGQGTTGGGEGQQVFSGLGVGLFGSHLRSGSGAITLDGRGGLGASGVRVADLNSDGGASSIESTSGDVSLTGSTRGWSTGDPLVVFRSDDRGGDFGGGGGVTLDGATVSTGGKVTMVGTGADLTALFNDPGFPSALIGNVAGNSATVGASSGVTVNRSTIIAGAGQQIALSGQAGSGAFSATINNATEGIDTLFDVAPAYGVAVSASFGQGGLRAEGGRIAIDGRGSDVALTYTDDPSEGGPLTLMDVSSTRLAGGSIDVQGRNVTVLNDFNPTADFVNASGAGSGGSISIRATADPTVAGSGSIAIDQNVGMLADAVTPVGNGGSIRVLAGGDLRTYGGYGARGGASGGNGGLVETSGANVELTGIRVDASAPAGLAGTWLVDPFNITIAHGTAAGSLPTLPFVALANSIIQDGDINAALNKGTNVTIGTGTHDPTSFAGNIGFDRAVDINLDSSAVQAVTFKLDAERDIRSDFTDTLIRSTGSQALNVEFNAGLSGSTGAVVFNGGSIQTNGGSVTMNALGGTFDGCAICLHNSFIDTRTGGTNAGLGGNVTLTVPPPGLNSATFTTTLAAVDINNTDIFTSTGNVGITGFSQVGSGVRLAGTIFLGEGSGSIQTTSGNITLAGVGAFSSNSADGPGNGVSIDAALLSTVDGNIAVRGLRQAGTTPGTGVSLRNGTQLNATGVGDIEVTGEALGGGTGLLLTGATTNAQGQPVNASKIDGNRNVVLRASNDGSSDAIVIDGTVRAGQVLNLRPGGVDAASGAGVDRVANPISLLGGTGAAGYAISADELGRMAAATVVVGSNAHAGNIDVLAPMTSAVPLTLENGGGGNITLDAPVSAPTLGLISGGNITQAAGAAITAGTLLAQSSGGNVILSDPGNNVSASTLGGGAAGRFEFVNSGPLRVGPVSVTGFDAASNLPQVQSASSMAADTVLVRTLAGELILGGNVSSTSGADLVAATTFQNVGGGISGAPWRVWADTWVGESRGGLVGSGLFPNLYHCAYLGTCTVSVSPGDNHFIYAQQPTATVTLDNLQRAFGQDNPRFTFTLAGLILSDTGVGIAGNPSTTADTQSPAGRYPIFGTFASAEGYALNVVPGELLVTALAPVPVPVPVPAALPVPVPTAAPVAAFVPPVAPARFVEVLREEPTTWLYDRNMGQAPICLASGPLDGERTQQGNDQLAREWSRVRTRPNLTSCVDTERHNGCSDF